MNCCTHRSHPCAPVPVAPRAAARVLGDGGAPRGAAGCDADGPGGAAGSLRRRGGVRRPTRGAGAKRGRCGRRWCPLPMRTGWVAHAHTAAHLPPLVWHDVACGTAAVTVAAAQLARRTALLAKEVQLPARLLLQAASMRVLKLQEVTVRRESLYPLARLPACPRAAAGSGCPLLTAVLAGCLAAPARGHRGWLPPLVRGPAQPQEPHTSACVQRRAGAGTVSQQQRRWRRRRRRQQRPSRSARSPSPHRVHVRPLVPPARLYEGAWWVLACMAVETDGDRACDSPCVATRAGGHPKVRATHGRAGAVGVRPPNGGRLRAPAARPGLPGLRRARCQDRGCRPRAACVHHGSRGWRRAACHRSVALAC